MGYRIAYNGYEIRKVETISKSKERNVKKISLLIVGVILLVIGVVGHEYLEQMLIPGDKIVTKTAFSHMMTDIKSGEPVAEAFTDFCKVIIDYADVK